jgi:hypothetical protein
MKATSLLGAIALMFGFLSAQAQQTEIKQVSSFSKVQVGGSYDVYLQEGDKEEVKLVGDAEEIEKVEIKVDGNGTLRLGQKSGSWKWSSNKKLTAYITYKKLEALHSSGSSTVIGQSKIKANHFDIHCSGSGDIKIELAASTLDISVSGSGNVEVNGNVQKQEISVSGSGEVEALGLEGKEAEVSVSGSGNVAVNVSETLKGNVTGSGDIRYRGNPKQFVRITGSGSIKSVR